MRDFGDDICVVSSLLDVVEIFGVLDGCLSPWLGLFVHLWCRWGVWAAVTDVTIVYEYHKNVPIQPFFASSLRFVIYVVCRASP